MDNIPEKFRNDDGTLNTDALMRSYNELEKRLAQWYLFQMKIPMIQRVKNLIVRLVYRKVRLNIQRMNCMMMKICVKNFLKSD